MFRFMFSHQSLFFNEFSLFYIQSTVLSLSTFTTYFFFFFFLPTLSSLLSINYYRTLQQCQYRHFTVRFYWPAISIIASFVSLPHSIIVNTTKKSEEKELNLNQTELTIMIIIIIKIMLPFLSLLLSFSFYSLRKILRFRKKREKEQVDNCHLAQQIEDCKISPYILICSRVVDQFVRSFF